MKNAFGFLLILYLCSGCHVYEKKEELICIQFQDRNGFAETINSPEKLSLFEHTDFLSVQPYTSVLRIYRKEQKNISLLTSYHPNGLVWQLLEAQERRACGSYKEWFSSGKLKIEGKIVGGEADLSPAAQESWLFDGICSVFDEEGNQVAAIEYNNGALHGTSFYYYTSGQLEKSVPYLQDKAEGNLLSFWESGELKEKTAFKENQKEGESFGFWEDGNLCWQEEFYQGRLEKGLYWNREKELISEVAHGSGFRAIFRENRLFSLEEISQGAPQGVVKIFHPDGSLSSLYHLLNGKKHGEEIKYFSETQGTDPLPKISLQWNEDSLCGIVKTWYPSGQLQSQREMRANKRSGPFCSWYPDGSLLCLEEYDEDLLLSGQYYKKGQKEPVSRVVQGNGTAFLYDEQGLLLHKVSYVKGNPVKPD